jgi:hypothetical protein
LSQHKELSKKSLGLFTLAIFAAIFISYTCLAPFCCHEAQGAKVSTATLGIHNKVLCQCKNGLVSKIICPWFNLVLCVRLGQGTQFYDLATDVYNLA